LSPAASMMLSLQVQNFELYGKGGVGTSIIGEPPWYIGPDCVVPHAARPSSSRAGISRKKRMEPPIPDT
jgi:hypothetical protein